jgi:hypothetical protein
MRLLTEGGTPLAAMHKYAPISDLVTLVNDNISPSTDCTKKMKQTPLTGCEQDYCFSF